ncbi:substrate-binding domain-containing protein [Cellulomonas sp. URHE0023]|uniref:substrate-binding domain-containing protein n=1 Tax=Cellulomonas sp. URHE0023 TaxID=1380354 RepID=UPI001E5981CF|nr:substrate-binding domain-containing protein [Cellulomonas sp. URHE0023]
MVATVLLGALGVASATSASADPSAQGRDIVGVGSDTTQYALNYLADGALVGASARAGFNAASNSRIVSYDAQLDGVAAGVVTQIQVKTGTALINRPNGSGAGKALLFGGNNNPNINFARASSTLNAAEIAGNLRQVPFAVDGLKLAVRAAGTNAPTIITGADLVNIYNGTYANWSQVPAGAAQGKSGVIVPQIPQSGSGTYTTFIAQLTSLNGGTPVVLAPTVVTVQEHDAAPIAANANAVAPFSTGRAASEPTVALVSGTGSYSFQRALYNVVRAADLGTPWFTNIFGPDGFICSGGGKALIGKAGFQQLAGEIDGGACGVAGTAAVTNFTLS